MCKRTLIALFCLLSANPVLAQVGGASAGRSGGTLYTYQNSISISEEFLSGVGVSGSIGSLGWNAFNVTAAQNSSITNHPGLYLIASSAVPGTVSALVLHGNTNNLVDPASSIRAFYALRLNSNDANTTIRVGLINSFTANPPSDGLYLEKLDADTDWFCVARNGGVQTRVTSSVPTSTAFTTVEIPKRSGAVDFKINGANVCNISSNLPTTFLDPAVQIISSVAESKTFDIDYFSLQIDGISR